MSLPFANSVVSTEWLAAHRDDPGIVILEGSFKLPGVTPFAAEDFAARHIPGARFFDIDAIADHETTLPHMLPSAAAFERHAAELGISNDSTVVVYEARPGLRSGHIPGSLNLPFNVFANPDTGEILDMAEIRRAFEAAGLDFAKPVIASCGSGVTAAALAFAYLAGKDDVAIYDGAWTEWGQPGDTPVDAGAGKSLAAR